MTLESLKEIAKRMLAEFSPKERKYVWYNWQPETTPPSQTVFSYYWLSENLPKPVEDRS